MRTALLLGIVWDTETGQISWPGGSFALSQSKRVESSAARRRQCGRDILDAPAMLFEELGTMPEIRQDRVTQVWNSIHAGTFSASNRQIAAAMLSDLQIVGGNFD